MSVSYSQIDVDHYNMRQRVKKQPDVAQEEFEGPEEDLCQEIIKECERRRWYFTRNRPGKRSTATAGTPDFVIAAPPSVYDPCEPRTFWIEVKKKGNKLSDKQTITKHVLLSLEHKWACIYSFAEFLKAIE